MVPARHLRLIVALICSVVVATCSAVAAQTASASVEVEVLPVLELPVAINKPVLVKKKDGYVLQCSVTNGSEFRQTGFRYSLAILDGSGATRIVSNSEGFTIPAYQTREITFKSPLKLKIKQGARVVLMLEQALSIDYVWEVIKSKDALTAYLKGDYSITPRVLRVINHVDAPFPGNRIRY